MTGAASLRAIVAPTAIAGALLIAGCGGDDEPTASVAVTATTASTPAATTPTATSTSGAGKQPGRTSTTRRSAKRKAAPVRTVAIAPARAKVGKAQTFSGDGDETLGTITLERSSVVRWTASGGSFALVATRSPGGSQGTGSAKKVSISGNAKSGQTFIAAGEYTSVKVAAKGAWTLSIAPLGD